MPCRCFRLAPPTTPHHIVLFDFVFFKLRNILTIIATWYFNKVLRSVMWSLNLYYISVASIRKELLITYFHSTFCHLNLWDLPVLISCQLWWSLFCSAALLGVHAHACQLILASECNSIFSQACSEVICINEVCGRKCCFFTKCNWPCAQKVTRSVHNSESVILFELQLLLEQLQFALSVYSCTSSGKHISFSLNTKESSARMRNFEIMLPNQNKNWTPEFSVISTFLLFHASRDNDLCKHWTQSPQTIISSGNVLFVIV